MDNILEIKSVSKKIGKKKILKDISLEVKEGEIFGFVGPNGAGKTTLIKTMLGLYKQDSGTIKIGGYDINKDFEKAMEKIGAIIENPEMYDYLSGKDNLSLYSKIGNKTDDEYQKKIVKTVKLEERIKNKVKTYSLGMRQRLGVAQALIGKPKLLVLDEPTNGLDPLGIKELRELLKTISKENNIAVFVSSHILSELESFCNKICIINNGSIISCTTMEKIKNIANRANYIIEVDNTNLDGCLSSYEIMDNKHIKISINEDSLNNLIKSLIINNINIYEIKKEVLSLEDIFIKLVGGNISV